MIATTVGQQQLVAARAAFAEGDARSLGVLPLPLQQSWLRSRAAGLLPGQEPDYRPLLGDGRHLSDPGDRRLARCVRPELEQLWAAFGGRGWTMFCANREGMVIAQQAHGLEDAPLLRPIQVGRRLGEGEIGTTAPAVSLADDLPALVRGNEHYLQRFAPVFCLSEPLHDLDGQVCGVIDITGLGERDPSLLQGYFRQAALASENRLFHTLADVHLLALQHDPRWLASPLQGLLAVQEDGQLRAANRVAR
ncbi:Fis family transcriptional regulator, partial [Stenotrophomonas maltophilia]